MHRPRVIELMEVLVQPNRGLVAAGDGAAKICSNNSFTPGLG